MNKCVKAGDTMAKKYNPGDAAFIVESSRFIREVKVVKFAGGLYTIKFTDSKGGIKVRENRLFSTKEDAEATIQKPKPQYKSPWEH